MIPEKTVTAYKLFNQDAAGLLYPLYVNYKLPLSMGVWLEAEIGEAVNGGTHVKSKLGTLAMRPGWHAGDYPVATHIGEKPFGSAVPVFRRPEQVWAEVELAADVDWQSEADRRAVRNKKGQIIARTAHITDQVPYGGFYRYKTGSTMTGKWLIGGNMKINRVLTDDEVYKINENRGIHDLPRKNT